MRTAVRAFTLIELLVALSVATVLVVGLAPLVRQVGETAERASGSLMLQAQAERILEVLARDLEAMVCERDDQVWFAVSLQTSPQPPLGDAGVADAAWSGLVKPPDGVPGEPGSSLQLAPPSQALVDYRFGQAGVWLRFFTTASDSGTALNNLSAPRGVSYQLVRRRVTASAAAAHPESAPRRYFLYRSSVRPMSAAWPDVNSTMAAGYDLFAAFEAPSYNIGDVSQIDNLGNVRTPRRYEQVLGGNVIDFGVRCWVRDELGHEVLRFPAAREGHPAHENRGFAATLRDGRWRSPSAVPPVPTGVGSLARYQMTYGYPVRVEVLLRVLSEEGARIMDAFEQGQRSRPETAGSDADHWWSLAMRYSEVFTRSITLYATPL